jgi:tRNA pseudouridine65 synthase
MHRTVTDPLAVLKSPRRDPLEIVYRDTHYVAVNKPAGLLVHRSGIDRHESRFALQMLRDQIGQRVYPLHRLDKPTSGVLLFALSPQAAGRLAPEFTTGRLSKTYLAVVRGHTEPEGTVDHPLKDRPDPMSDAQAGRGKAPQPAVTDYRCLATVEIPVRVDRYPTSRYSLIEVRPRTGRKHQIRRHMKHIAHPIIGDTSYGKARHNRLFRERFGCDRLLLAATELSFVHPDTHRTCTLVAGLDEAMGAVIRALGVCRI